MLLIGAGQLSEYLATMARFNGFAVTVCDPRPEYSGAWSVPDVTLTREMPDDVVQSFRPDRRSCVAAADSTGGFGTTSHRNEAFPARTPL